MSEHPEAAIYDWRSGDLRIFIQQTGHFPNEKSMTVFWGKGKLRWFMPLCSTYSILSSQALNYADRIDDNKTANIPMSNKDFSSIRYILAGLCIDRACWILECSR